MAIELFCTNCNKQLRVADDKMGKKVRCPKCETVNLVMEIVEVEVLPDPEPPPLPAPVMADPPEPSFDDDPDDAPVRFQDTDETDRPETPRRKKRKLKRSRKSGPGALLDPPALCLKIVIYIGIAVNVMLIIWNIVLLATAVSNGVPVGRVAGNFTGGFLGTAIWATLTLRGAEAMNVRSGYSTAILGCFAVMLPCSVMCLAGIPVGIWGLIILNLPDVKNSFHR